LIPARLVLGFFFLGGVLVMPACGKKSPPYLPKEPFTAMVVDLKGERSGDDIVLEGKIGGIVGPGEVTMFTGARVYIAQFPLNNPPCDECPIEYHERYDLGSEVFSGEKFLCRVPDRVKGKIYFFKVNIIGPGGVPGLPSNQVQIK
jgi:hypothetical protein